jgi:hypothetical protein
MKKLVNFKSVTRRKLIKILWDIGTEYYVMTDGSSVADEDFGKAVLEYLDKDQLLDILSSVLYQAHESAYDHMTPLLVCVTQKLTQHGVETPDMYELPSSEGMKLVRGRIKSFIPVSGIISNA